MKTKNIILAIIGLMLVAVTYALGNTIEAGGAVLAMAGGMFNTDSVHYRRLLLTKKMEKVVWNLSVWSQFMGIQKSDAAYKFGSPKSFKPTGKPIEVIKDFQHQGRVNMDIPVFYPLTDQPTYGGKQLLGNEESRRWANKTISINQVRHGVKSQDNKYSRQTLKNPEFVKELMNENTAALTDYFTRWQAFQPGLTYVQGYSDNLVAATADGGLGLTRKSHMNTYIAGYGRVTWSATHATYEANVNAGLDRIDGASTDENMTSTVIQNMVYEASHTHRIQPIKFKNGMSAYVIVISDSAALQLKSDSTWLAAQRSAFQQHGENHPELTGKVLGYYAGAYIIIDETLPSAYVDGESPYTNARSTTGDNTGVCYGLSNYIATPVDTGSRKPNILIGASSIACGVANEIGFETEDWDYKQQLTEAADMIIGYEIADIIDSDGKFTTAGNRYENVSSLVCWTYSPSASSW